MNFLQTQITMDREDIIVYINSMIDKGFPAYYFEPLFEISVESHELRRSSNAKRFEQQASNYFHNERIDPISLTCDEVPAIAFAYVQESIPPQFETQNEDEDCWHDETYDLWIDVFVSFCAVACLNLFKSNQQKYIKLNYG